MADPRMYEASAGYDLSLLAACNHTIQSYGSYSFWAGFLAGRGAGKRITPHLYQTGYKDLLNDKHDPPRFYYIEGTKTT